MALLMKSTGTNEGHHENNECQAVGSGRWCVEAGDGKGAMKMFGREYRKRNVEKVSSTLNFNF